MMASEQKLGNFKQGSDSGLRSATLANSAEQDVASFQEFNLSDTPTSVCPSASSTSGIRREYHLERFAEPGAQNRSNSFYGHCYPGNDGINFGWPYRNYSHARDVSELPIQTSGFDLNVSKFPVDPRSNLSTTSSNYKPTFHSSPVNTSNKAPYGYCYQLPGRVDGSNPVRKVSSLSNQRQGVFPHNGPFSHRPIGDSWTGSDRYYFGGKFNTNGNLEAAKELNRGPRALRGRSSAESEQLGPRVRRERYNSQDFRTVYDNANFFIIKSYSEDDIHKSIKYDVWASTPNGNRKLDAAFHDAETKSCETGTSCPIFLFFSVNTSGQFVGLAEMIGRVDFKKDMDFWQQDKWNGFFPVKWHVIKDIPNNTLRHIILENNDHKPVTYTRDTQEVGLKQGLEMLNIFKSYREETSILDDFSFYEDREKSLHARRSIKVASPEVEIYRSEIPHINMEPNVRNGEHVRTRSRRISESDTQSLVSLTRNLSLNRNPPKPNPGRS